LPNNEPLNRQQPSRRLNIIGEWCNIIVDNENIETGTINVEICH